MGAGFNPVQRKFDMKGASSSGGIPGVLRPRGDFAITYPLTAEYPKADATTAVNAIQTGDGSGVGPSIQAWDSWTAIADGLIGSGLNVTYGNFIVAKIDNAGNNDSDRDILEAYEMDLKDRTQAQAVTDMSNLQLVKGGFYRITDRYNCILQAISPSEFALRGVMTVPNGTTPQMTQDEIIQVEYNVLGDAVYWFKDRLQNEYDKFAVGFANFGPVTLTGLQFGNPAITLQRIDNALPNFTSITTGVVSDNAGDGSIVLSGNCTVIGNRVLPYSILDADTNGVSLYNTIENNATLNTSFSSFASSNRISTGAYATVSDNSLLFNTVVENGSYVSSVDSALTISNIVSAGCTLQGSNSAFIFYNQITTASQVFISNTSVVQECLFGNGATYVVSGATNLTNCKLTGVGANISSGTYIGKILEVGRSTFDLTIDYDTLVGNTLNLIGYEYVGIVYLYSGTGQLTGTIDKIITNQSNHGVKVYGTAGFDVIMNLVNKPAGVNQILTEGPAGAYTFYGDYDDYIEVFQYQGKARVSKIGGIQYS